MTEPHAPTVRPATPPLIIKMIPWLVLCARRGIPPLLMGDNDYRMAQFAKYLALAILALGIDLIWGYTGLLSLGQGLYFGLGAYRVAYGLEMQQVADDAHRPPGTVPPGFMTNYMPITNPGYVEPWALKYIAPLANTWVALGAAVLLPVLAATLFGLVTFRLRIRGVYFALITQALLLAIYTLFLNQQPLTGGFVGIKNLADLQLFGFIFNDSKHAIDTYYLVAAVLLVCLGGCWLLVHSKVGKVLTAIRDNENRVLALGYNPAAYKLFVFAIAGGLAGVAGRPVHGGKRPGGTRLPRRGVLHRLRDPGGGRRSRHAVRRGPRRRAG